MKTPWSILLVDDDEDDFILTREMLSQTHGRKCRLAWAPDFKTGEAALAAELFDAVLMDYDLGACSGLDLIREATRNDYPAPFLLLTGRGNYDVDVEAMEAGATLYLTKSEANPLLLERSIRYAIERKRIEEQLRASERKFSTLFEKAPFAVILTTLEEGIILEVNQSFVNTFGYSKGEAVGRTSLDLGLNRDAEQRAFIIQQVQEHGFVHEIEGLYFTRTGERKWMLANFDLVEIGQEKFRMTTAIDITEWKKAQRLIQHQSSLLENISEAIVSADLNFVVQTWNSGAEATYGWTAGEAAGRRFDELVPTDYLAATLEQVMQAVEEAGSWKGDILQTRKDGSQAFMHASFTLDRDELGEPLVILVNREAARLP